MAWTVDKYDAAIEACRMEQSRLVADGHADLAVALNDALLELKRDRETLKRVTHAYGKR